MIRLFSCKLRWKITIINHRRVCYRKVSAMNYFRRTIRPCLMQTRFPLLFFSLSSSCSSQLAVCSNGVRSGVMKIFLTSFGLLLLRSLVQFRSISAFSCSVLTVIFSKQGLSLRWPIRNAFTTLADVSIYLSSNLVVAAMSSCFLSSPLSFEDSDKLCAIKLSLCLDFSFSSFIRWYSSGKSVGGQVKWSLCHCIKLG